MSFPAVSLLPGQRKKNKYGNHLRGLTIFSANNSQLSLHLVGWLDCGQRVPRTPVHVVARFHSRRHTEQSPATFFSSCYPKSRPGPKTVIFIWFSCQRLTGLVRNASKMGYRCYSLPFDLTRLLFIWLASLKNPSDNEDIFRPSGCQRKYSLGFLLFSQELFCITK